ncbi:MAG: hypothetical protein ACLRLE_07965 [Turicibacter sp.]|nr:hypothetical protein [Turicibacter sp. GALT-G1]MCU7193561.1 hypothetical protein [Turicibacter sp. T129]
MANEEAKKPSKKRNVTKKQVVLYSYIGVLAVVTVLFGYNVLKYFYLDPLKVAGQPIYGYRTENLQPITDSMISNAEQVGASQSGVKEIKVTVQGPVVYFDVRVNDGVDVEKARAAAEAAATEFLAQAGDVANGYTVQLVVSSGDIKTLVETNREEELAYYKEHRLDIVERIVAQAEKYPTAKNIERAQNNINVMPKDYNEKTGQYEARYPEEKAAFQARIDALTPLTAEEEEELGEIPYLEVDQSIKPTNISPYPCWGAYDTTTETFEWQ